MNNHYTKFIILVVTLIIIGINILLGIVLIDNSRASLKVLIDAQMLNITNTAAALLDGNELRDIQDDDKETAAYKKINNTLIAFHHDENLRYIHCIRDMGDNKFVFTVDPTIINSGEFNEPVEYTDALYKASMGTAATDNEPYSDRFGRFYSAYSPVFDSESKVAGIVAADFDADWYEEQLAIHQRLIEVSILASILCCLFLIWVLSKRIRATENTLKVSNALNSHLSLISNIYVSIYEVNIDTDCFTEIKPPRAYRSRPSKVLEKGAGAMMKDLARKASTVDSRDEMLQFVAMDTLKDRLKDTDTISIEFMDKNRKSWIRARFLVSRRDNEGLPVSVLLMEEDINKEKKSREKLIGMSERAIAASEAKSSFISSVTHDIRTPISVILGMNEMILRECDDKNVISYAENIKNAGGTLLELITNVLDFSKIEAGKLELIPVEYDLSDILREIINMTQVQVDSKGITLDLDFDKNTPKLLFGDEIRIKQIITNLLTNAVKYTTNGRITFIIGSRNIHNDPENIMLYVSVRDTGIGIKPEDKDRLFEEFKRVDEERNRNITGTGLGITITQNLLNMMGSTLHVDSIYGQGSNFYFHLKQKVVKWEPLGDCEDLCRTHIRNRNAYREKLTAPRASILVVDDNPMNLMVFSNLLKKTLVKIDTANNADEGLRLTKTMKYDMIFLDHLMPGKNGIEMLTELREQEGGLNIETPAICITANAISGARAQYISAGFDDFITKPIDTNKLEDILLFFLPREKLEAPLTENAKQETDDLDEIPDIIAPLMDQDWIDLSTGIKNSGSVDSYLLLLRAFYDSLDEKMDEIDNFYREGNISDYTIKIHAMKSSARLIGAMDLGYKAQWLENAATNGDIEYIRNNHNAFSEACRESKHLLSKFFNNEEPAHMNKPEADAKIMEAAYRSILESANNMDCEQLDNIFSDMEKYRIPTKDEYLWTQLKKAVEQYNYDKLLSLLS